MTCCFLSSARRKCLARLLAFAVGVATVGVATVGVGTVGVATDQGFGGWAVAQPAKAAAAMQAALGGDIPDSLQHDVLTTWTTDQGLPQNFIRSITQTSDGFLWIGTMNGLVRFDGLRFRSPGPDLPSALHGNVSDLEPDANGGLWAATTHCLFHRKDQLQRFLPVAVAGRSGPKADPCSYRIDAITRSFDGEMWVYGDGKLYRTRKDVLEPHGLPPGAQLLRDIAETADHTLWLADGQAVYAMRGTAVRGTANPIRYPLPGVRMLYADRFGGLYAGDGHKLFRFQQQSSAFVPVSRPGLGNFVGVMVDHRHSLWMASGGLHGLSRKAAPEEPSGRIETLTTADGLASDDVRVLFEDRSHDVWIGTIAGLERLHKGIFTTYTGLGSASIAGATTTQSGSEFESIFEEPADSTAPGTLWAGTLQAGVVRVPARADALDSTWQRFGQKEGLPDGQPRGFAMDGGLPAVALSDYGIYSLRGRRFALLPGMPHGYVDNPVTTADGSLWFGIQHGGIYRKTDGRITRMGPADGLPDAENHALTLALDRTGGLRVAAGNKLYQWKQGRFSLIVSVVPTIFCSAVLDTPAGGDDTDIGRRVVVGTQDGLAIPTKDGHRMLKEENGLPGEAVLDVLEDAGGLWIATPRAIARISREQWTAFADGRTSHIQPEIYTQADGLRSNTVLPLGQITAIGTRDRRIWFATPRGLSVLDPGFDADSNPEPAVPAVIDSVVVDDREQALAESLVEPPGQHRITFAYTTAPAPAPEQIRFSYRLDGWDKDWIDAGTSREVSYTALPPGRYTFEVVAITRSGKRSVVPLRLSLVLRPFFWQTRWFFALVILLVAAVLVEITRRRTRASGERLSMQFQERAAERERIAYQIHDTVIQDMIGTALQLELLGFHISEQPEKAAANLDTLAARLRETIARSRNMVWSLHSTAVVQYSLVEVLRHAEAEFRLADVPRFDLFSSGETRDLHPLVRDEVYRICREALANSFRHSGAQDVSVTVRFLPDVLEVEIADDGRGIEEEIRLHGRPGHFGLQGMQAHAQRIGAQLSINSTPGLGTRILLRVGTRESAWWWKRRSRRSNVDILQESEIEMTGQKGGADDSSPEPGN